MASILYPSLIVPADFCIYLGNCQQRDWRLRSGDWTCVDCTIGLEFAAGHLADEQVVAAAISILQGDVFCGAEGATPDCADQVSTELCCTALHGTLQMAAWLPVALPVLAGALDAQKVEICQEEIGVCLA